MPSSIIFLRKYGSDFTHPMLLAGTKAEDLKAARIRHQGSVPAHKPVEPPHLGYEIFPWLQVQMVGIRNNDLASDFMEILG